MRRASMGQESVPAGQDPLLGRRLGAGVRASERRRLLKRPMHGPPGVPLRRRSGQVANLYQLTGCGGPTPLRSLPLTDGGDAAPSASAGSSLISTRVGSKRGTPRRAGRIATPATTRRINSRRCEMSAEAQCDRGSGSRSTRRVVARSMTFRSRSISRSCLAFTGRYRLSASTPWT